MDWQAAFHNRDRALMGRIAGRCHGEVVADIGGQRMIDRQVQTFDAAGGYGCEDETCSLGRPMMPCSTNRGHGRWGAVPQGDGFLIARDFRDLVRFDACGGFLAALGPDGSLHDPRTGQRLAQRL